MYVYLIAPTAILLALYIGFWPKRLPMRAYVWLLAVDLAMTVGEYFSGYFPTINLLFWIFIVVFAIVVRVIRMLLNRSLTLLAGNRTLAIILAVVLFLIALAVLGGFAILLAVIAFAVYQSSRRKKGSRSVSAKSPFDSVRDALAKLGPLTLLVIAAVLAIIVSLGATAVARGFVAATTYHEQAGLVQAQTTATLPLVNDVDIPIVEHTNAAILLANVIGGLGPQYHVSNEGLALVRFHGQLVWTAPLEFNNGLIWLTKRTSPGYVWTSASNPSAKPTLVLGNHYLYTPQAGLWDNLQRILYQHYPEYYLGTTDWEIDPSGKGYWITSLYKPAPGLTSLVTRVMVGSAMTDPTTGTTVMYPLGKQPTWVSQVVGPEFAQNEADRYGWDRAGFIAATFTHQNATIPVHSTPYNVLLDNGALGWEIPMSSPSNTDNSLAGLLLINAETNQVTFTSFTGVQNDMAASQRINGATINSTLSAGRPLLYNWAGALAYVAPIVNSSGIVQEVAVVDPHNTVQPIVASNLPGAMSNWQSYLASGDIGLSPGNKGTGLKTVTGTVERVATFLTSSGSSGSTVKENWLFLIHHQAYTADMSISPNVIPFVQAGDHVTITYVPSDIPYSITAITDQTLQKKP